MNNTPRCQHAMNRRQVLALLGEFGVSADALALDPARLSPSNYRVAFENDRVRVLEFMSHLGVDICGRGMHTHPAHLVISLTDAKAKVTLPDGKVVYGQNKAGDMFWEPAVTHTVENIGGKGVRAYLIELKDKDWQPSTG